MDYRMGLTWWCDYLGPLGPMYWLLDEHSYYVHQFTSIELQYFWF
jgi:hypothetical protein